MSYINYIHNRNLNNYQKFNTGDPDNYYYNKKQKNIFRESPNLPHIKKIVFRTPNIYRSFINSSALFNYYNNPLNKNEYCVYYNGGPKKQVNVSRDSNNLRKRKMLNENNVNQYGYYMPKLNRSLSQYENYKYKNLSYNNYQYNKENYNYFNKTGFHHNNHISPAPNRVNFNGFMTHKPTRNKKQNFIYNFNNNEFNQNSNYDYKNESENNDEKNKRNSRNKVTSSSVDFIPSFEKSFHKTQIFNRCKPFLVDGFQEFPD